LGDTFATGLLPLLTYHKSLKELSVPHCRIGEEGMEVVAEMILNNKVLLSLDLSYNGAVGKSARLIGEAVGGNASLTHLDLSWNSFGNERSGNGVELREVMVMSKDPKGKPKEKRIWQGGLDTGAKAMAAALEENKTLRFLSLANNNIREEGCISLVHKLAVNTSLTMLDLSFNPLGTPFIMASIHNGLHSPPLTLHNGLHSPPLTLHFPSILLPPCRGQGRPIHHENLPIRLPQEQNQHNRMPLRHGRAP